MSILNKVLKIVSNVQILSALIWAIVILSCTYITKDPMILNILITGAGFHVVLMSTKLTRNAKNRKVSTSVQD